MIFRIFVTLALGLIIGLASANNAFSPGSIITKNGDTIAGNIEFQKELPVPFEILFTEEGSTDIKLLNPNDIVGFFVGDATYRSANIDVYSSDFSEQNSTDSTLISSNKRTVFLKEIISGAKQLLLYEHINGEKGFYIPDENNNYQWLEHRKSVYRGNGKKLTATNNNYIGQLIIYLNDCPKINNIISTTNYNIESLKKTFNYYYDCKGLETDYVIKENPYRLQLSPLVGLSGTKISFSGAGNEHLTNTIFPWSANLTFGASVDLFISKISKQWSVNNELLYTRFMVKKTYNQNINSSSYNRFETKIGASYLKLNTMFRGRIPVNYATLFMDVGVSNSISLNQTNTVKKTVIVGSNQTVSEGKAINDIKYYNFGFIVGFGINVKKMTATLRYEIGSRLTADPEIDSRINRLYIVIGYNLF